LILCNMS